MAASPAPLTGAQKEFFLQNGFLKLTGCFTPQQAAEITEGMWTRLNMKPHDQRTWSEKKVNMPWHRTFDVASFAPKAWAAMCELCGGAERITEDSRLWRDSLIVNLGTAEGKGKPVPPRELNNWHVDGDFFVHYLNSPEQALLVIPLFTDIPEEGGGTMICPDAIPKIARWLYEHPEGVSPRMVPRCHADFDKERNLEWYQELVQSCDQFVEARGQTGDVFLLHPLMLHSATSNARRNVRVITNPPVHFREPQCFDRPDGTYSLVEQKTIESLGGEARIRGWKATMPPETVVPARIRIQEEMKRQEALRLADSQGSPATA